MAVYSIHYFAGANTARGFVSRFEDILPRQQQKRMYYIKGGPGVGKSTLMKRFAARAEEQAWQTEYYHCSSDPDSLDGVSLPVQGIGLMDGTAPHVYDPVLPAARDTLVSLGDFLDEKALAPRAGEIAAVQAQISARFARCCRYLAASEQVLCAAPSAVENSAKARALCAEITQGMPLRGGAGSVRRLFGAAFTPKGLTVLTDLGQFDGRITVDTPFGAHATGFMQRITERALERGLHAVQLLDPLIPERIAHVLIPAHGLAYCTGRRTQESAGEWVEAEKLFDLTGEKEHGQGFDRNACELLWQRASEQLSAAKSLHDELERFYIQNMDFQGWQGALETMLEANGL